jgi:rubredoxin-NAD+ reductase
VKTVIIGTGLAGYSVARELRRLSEEAGLSLITIDDGCFYSKPRISNGFAGNKSAAALRGHAAEAMSKQLGAEIFTHTRVTAIDPDGKTVSTQGQTVHYDKLVLAIGAEPIQVPLKGDAAHEVLSVNNLADYGVLRERLQDGARVTILGAGLIGSEFANDLSSAGFHVTLVDPEKAPLGRLLPDAVGAMMADAFAQHGITMHFGALCESLHHTDTGFLVQLNDGTTFESDLVISAVGLRVNPGLPGLAGIAIDRGIVVNRYLETSQADIYALGDCVEVCGLTLPYVAPIAQCARALARTLAGQPTPVSYAAMPVIVKTPAYPLVICPSMDNEGEWSTERLDRKGAKLLFHGPGRELRGFVLAGDQVIEQRTLAGEVLPWLA